MFFILHALFLIIYRFYSNFVENYTHRSNFVLKSAYKKLTKIKRIFQPTDPNIFRHVCGNTGIFLGLNSHCPRKEKERASGTDTLELHILPKTLNVNTHTHIHTQRTAWSINHHKRKAKRTIHSHHIAYKCNSKNKIQKWVPLRAMKTFIRKKMGHTT